jgi:hypothetical protein
MQKPLVIGLIGKSRAGKDTTADYLCSAHGFTKIAVADPLKEAMRAIFAYSREQTDGALKEEIDANWGTSPREMMQFVGTSLFRDTLGAHYPAIGADIWARALASRIASASARVVVSDIRFPNEAKVIARANGVLVRIVRARVCASQTDVHISEYAADSIVADFELNNNNSRETLFARINDMMPRILARLNR